MKRPSSTLASISLALALSAASASPAFADEFGKDYSSAAKVYASGSLLFCRAMLEGRNAWVDASLSRRGLKGYDARAVVKNTLSPGLAEARNRDSVKATVDSDTDFLSALATDEKLRAETVATCLASHPNNKFGSLLKLKVPLWPLGQKLTDAPPLQFFFHQNSPGNLSPSKRSENGHQRYIVSASGALSYGETGTGQKWRVSLYQTKLDRFALAANGDPQSLSMTLSLAPSPQARLGLFKELMPDITTSCTNQQQIAGTDDFFSPDITHQASVRELSATYRLTASFRNEPGGDLVTLTFAQPAPDVTFRHDPLPRLKDVQSSIGRTQGCASNTPAGMKLCGNGSTAPSDCAYLDKALDMKTAINFGGQPPLPFILRASNAPASFGRGEAVHWGHTRQHIEALINAQVRAVAAEHLLQIDAKPDFQVLGIEIDKALDPEGFVVILPR